MSSPARVLSNLLTLTTTLTNVAYELSQLNQLLQQAHDRGETLSQDDWDRLDADLAAARRRAHEATSG